MTRCLIDRENDISGSVGFEDGERSSRDVDKGNGGSWEAGGIGGSWEALVSVSRTGEEISLRFLLKDVSDKSLTEVDNWLSMSSVAV